MALRFVFTKLFYVMLAVGFIPLSLSWGRPGLRWLTLLYDFLLLTLAFIDGRMSGWPKGVSVEREFGGRFAVGAEGVAFKALCAGAVAAGFALFLLVSRFD